MKIQSPEKFSSTPYDSYRCWWQTTSMKAIFRPPLFAAIYSNTIFVLGKAQVKTFFVNFTFPWLLAGSLRRFPVDNNHHQAQNKRARMKWPKHPENDNTRTLNTASAYIWTIIPLWYRLRFASFSTLECSLSLSKSFFSFLLKVFVLLSFMNTWNWWTSSADKFAVHKFETCLVYHNTHLVPCSNPYFYFPMTMRIEEKKSFRSFIVRTCLEPHKSFILNFFSGIIGCSSHSGSNSFRKIILISVL